MATGIMTAITFVLLTLWLAHRIPKWFVYEEGGDWHEGFVCSCGKFSTEYTHTDKLCKKCGNTIDKSKASVLRYRFTFLGTKLEIKKD